jgi:hypothetical protein
MLGERGPAWFVFVVLDPLLLTGGTWLLLKLFAHPERFLQTATAVLGTGALLGVLLFLPLQGILSVLDVGPESPAAGILHCCSWSCLHWSRAVSCSWRRIRTCSPASRLH